MRALLAHEVRAPYILTDEFVYERLAVAAVRGWEAFAHAARDFPFFLYSIAIAPAFLLPHAGHAYDAAKTINAFLVSSVCFPVFLIAQQVAPGSIAFRIALLSLLLPSLGYAGTLMSENLYYPLFLLTVYALLRAHRAAYRRGLVAFGILLGLLWMTKIQAVAVGIAALLLAAVSDTVGRSNHGRGFATPRVLGAIAVAVAIQAARVGMLRGWSPFPLDRVALMGPYAQQVPQSAPGVVTWLWAVGRLLLALAAEAWFVPAVFGLVAMVFYAARCRRREFPLAFVTLVVLLLVSFGAARQTLLFDSPERIHLRYLAMLAPLLLVLAAVARRDGLVRDPVAWVAAAVLAVLVALACRDVNLAALGSDTLSLAWVEQHGRFGLGPPAFAGALLCAGMSVAAVALRWPHLVPYVLVAVVAGFTSLTAAAQRDLAGSRPSALIVLVERLRASGAPVHLILDAERTRDFVRASFFDFGDSQLFQVGRPEWLPALPDGSSGGRLPLVERAAAGGYVIAPETVEMNRPPVAAAGGVRAFRTDDIRWRSRRSQRGVDPTRRLGRRARLTWQAPDGPARVGEARIVLSARRMPAACGPTYVALRTRGVSRVLRIPPGDRRRVRMTVARDADGRFTVRLAARRPAGIADGRCNPRLGRIRFRSRPAR